MTLTANACSPRMRRISVELKYFDYNGMSEASPSILQLQYQRLRLIEKSICGFRVRPKVFRVLTRFAYRR